MLSEVDTACQFANDKDIDLTDVLKRRCRCEFLEQECRSQIRIESQPRTKSQESSLGSDLRRDIIPLVASDSTEQNGVRITAYIERLLRQRNAVLIDRAASGFTVLKIDIEPGLSCYGLQYFDRRCRDLRAYAVAAYYSYRVLISHISYRLSAYSEYKGPVPPHRLSS